MLLPLQESNHSSGAPKTDFLRAWTDESLKCATDSKRRKQQSQRASAALHQFKQSAGDHASLIRLCCWDSVVAVNASFLDNVQCSGRSSLRFFRMMCNQVRPAHQTIFESTMIQRSSVRDKKELKLVSSGTIVAFELVSDASVAALVLLPHPMILWITSVVTGDILGYVDDYAHVQASRLLFQILNVDTRSATDDPKWWVCVAASSTGGPVPARFTMTHGKCNRLQREVSMPLEKTHDESKHSTIVSTTASASAVIVATRQGKIHVWQMNALASYTKPTLKCEEAFQITGKDEELHALVCVDVSTVKKCPDNICAIQMSPDEAAEIEEWEASLDSETTRLVLYLFDDGEVVKVPAESFDTRFASLDDVQFEREFLLPPSREISLSVLSDKIPSCARVVLQKRQIVRIAFFACRQLRNGIFTQKSMNELFEDLDHKQIIRKTRADFNKFSESYRENVDMDVKVMSRADDSTDCEIVLEESNRKRRTVSDSLNVLFAVIKNKISHQTQLHVWKLASEAISPSKTCLTREELRPELRTTRLRAAAEALQLKSSYCLEMARFISALDEQQQQPQLLPIKQQRERRLCRMKSSLTKFFSDARSVKGIAEDLLQTVHELNLLSVSEVGRTRHMESFVEAVYFAATAERSGSSADGVVNATTVHSLQQTLRSDRWRRNPFFQEWVDHFSTALSGLSPSRSVRWSEIQLILRSIEQGVMTIEMVIRLCQELGISTSDDPGPSGQFVAIAKKLRDFLRAAKGEQTAQEPPETEPPFAKFISPCEFVEFLVETNDFPAFFDHQFAQVTTSMTKVSRQSQVVIEVDELYVLMLHSFTWKQQVGELELKQIEMNQNEASKTFKLPASTAHKLKQLLTTSLPQADTIFSSVVLKARIELARVPQRSIFEADGRRGERGVDSVPLFVVIVRLWSSDEQHKFQQELAFYRKLQHWSARELFLPVCFAAMDAPIIDQSQEYVAVAKEDGCTQTLVTESLAGCATLSDCIEYMRIPGLALRHWAPILLFWCHQVLLAMIAMKNEAIVAERVEFESLLVTSDGKELRFASLNSGHVADTGKGNEKGTALDEFACTFVFGDFVLRLLKNFCTSENEMSELDISASCEQEDEESMCRRKRKQLLGLLQSQQVTEDPSPLPITELSQADEILLSELEGVDSAVCNLFKLGLVALQRRSSRPGLESLWRVLFSNSPNSNAIPDSLCEEMMTLIRLQHTFHERILGSLRYCKSSEDADLFESVVRTWKEFSPSLFDGCSQQLEPTFKNTVRHMNSRIYSHLKQLVVKKQTLKTFTEAGLSTFSAFTASGDGAKGHQVIQSLLSLLDFNFRLLNQFEEVAWNRLPFLHTVLSQSLLCLCQVSSSRSFQPFGSTGETNGSSSRAAAADLSLSASFSVLWRLSEAHWRDLLGVETAKPRYLNLLAILKVHSDRDLTTEDGDVIDIVYEPPTSSFGLQHGSAGDFQIRLWWSDQHCALPRLEPYQGATKPDEACLSFGYLKAFYRTLDVYFNLTGGIAVSKFRIAALHQWFSATFLERKACFPMVFVRSTAARVWRDLCFGDFLCKLLRDREESVILGAMSLLECATRVFRFDCVAYLPCGIDSNVLGTAFSSPQSPRLAAHLYASSSLAFARSLCSYRVISEVRSTLERVTRSLKTLGESGAYSRSPSKPNTLTSILNVIFSVLVNCLHHGDAATQHWAPTGLVNFILSHAKANSLAFVNAVDSNVLNDVFKQSKRLLAQRGQSTWKVFTALNSESATKNSTGLSPFKLLLIDIVAFGGPKNLMLTQSLLNSQFFRREAHSLATRPPAMSTVSFVQQIDLLFSREFGKRSHAHDIASDLRCYNGTLGEVLQLVSYAKALFVRQKALEPAMRLSSSSRGFVRVFAQIWRWMGTAWLELLRGSHDSPVATLALMQYKLIVASLLLLHQVTISPYMTVEELLDLTKYASSGETVGDEGPNNAFQKVFTLLNATLKKCDDAAATSENETTSHGFLTLIVTIAVELVVNVMQVRQYDAVAAAILEKCVSSVTFSELLGREISGCRVYGIMDKQRLWAALLQLNSRVITKKLLEEEFMGQTVFKKLLLSNSTDKSHAERLNSKLEALMFLEVLCELSCNGTSTNSTPSVNSQLLLSDICKLVLLHNVIFKEASVVRDAQRHGNSSGAGRHEAVAKRVLQLICCVCFDFSAQRANPAFLTRLEGVGVPLWVISFHQQTSSRRIPAEGPCSDAEAKRQCESVRLFWKDWNGQQTAKTSAMPSRQRAIAIHESQAPALMASPLRNPPKTAPRRIEYTPPIPVQQSHRSAVKDVETSSPAPALAKLCAADAGKIRRAPAGGADGENADQAAAAQHKRMDPIRALAPDEHLQTPERRSMVSPVKTSHMAFQRFGRERRPTGTTKPAVKVGGVLVQTLLSVDMESAQILSKWQQQTAKHNKQQQRTEKKGHHIGNDHDDAASLESEAYSPFALQSSSASSGNSDSDMSHSSRAQQKKKTTKRRSKEAKHDKKKAAAMSSSSDAGSSFEREECRKRRASRHRKPSDASSFVRPEASSPSSESEPQQTRTKAPSRSSRHSVEPATTTADTVAARNGLGDNSALRLVFRKYDVDGDGAISFIDLRRALNQRGSQQWLSDVEIQQWITQKDRSGLGVVSFADFCAAFEPAAAVSAECSQPAAMRDPHPSGRQVNAKPSVAAATSTIYFPDTARKPAATLTMKSSSAQSAAPEGRRLGYAHEHGPLAHVKSKPPPSTAAEQRETSVADK